MISIQIELPPPQYYWQQLGALITVNNKHIHMGRNVVVHGYRCCLSPIELQHKAETWLDNFIKNSLKNRKYILAPNDFS